MVNHESSMANTIHSTGFVVLDLLVADGEMTCHVGGTAANVAINLSLLGWDAAVSGLIGDDPAGHEIRRQFTLYGVDTTALINDPEVETPVVIHEVTKDRHRFRFSCPHCGTKYAKFRPLPPTKASTAPAADVHFFDRASSYAIEVSRLRRDTSAVVFEPGTPGRPPATTSMVRQAHFLRASGDLELPPDAVAAQAQKPQVIGLGSAGVKYRAADTEWRSLPSRLLDLPVDAGGAGDWLTAAVLDGLGPSLVRSKSVGIQDLERTVDRALDFAAACCRHLGTRGLVGTDDWAHLTMNSPRDVQISQVEQVQAGTSQRKVGCHSWFHFPRLNKA
ncbi:PfkB family carbohydrate kinase [Mycobacterium marinum]|uniref:PfkB family carbohydrate kinase n=1 Tax=Mycobacterium marinum TaxID=1781 RepID=UPI000E3EAEF0|nr:PfkB family carbohydrate kinase [Mycobacterium marinum]